MKLTDILDDVGPPVAYYPQLRDICGSVNAVLLVCQFVYWRGKQADKEGWLYKAQSEIQNETGLTREEQETARKKLRDRGILKEKKKGIPCQLYYLLDLDQVKRLWEARVAAKKGPINEDNQQIGQNQQSCAADYRMQALVIPESKHKGFSPTTTEITTETTSEIIITPLAETDESLSAAEASSTLIKTEWSLTPPPVGGEEKKSESKPPKIGFDYTTHKFTNLSMESPYIATWKEAYPAIDVIGELKQTAAWLVSNPKNKKTDLLRFINSWLQKAQNKAPAQGGGPIRPGHGAGKGTQVRTVAPTGPVAEAVHKSNMEAIRVACIQMGVSEESYNHTFGIDYATKLISSGGSV